MEHQTGNCSKSPVFFDIKTNSDDAYNSKNLSEIQYIQDPYFKLVSITVINNGIHKVWPGENTHEWLEQFKEWNKQGRRFVAHNARFALRVLKYKYDFAPESICDTNAICRYLSYNADKMTTESTELSIHGNNRTNLCQNFWGEFSDKLPSGELTLIQQTLKMQLRKQYFNEDGAIELIRICQQEQTSIEQSHPVIKTIHTKPEAIKSYLRNTFNVEVPSISKKKIGNLDRFGQPAANFLHNLYRYKDLQKNLKDVTSLKERMRVDKKNILIDLNYCGAHSHRWTSGKSGTEESFNYQSISKDSGIRELIIPRPGNVFIIGDLAQIEARITAWLADETTQLDAFRNNRDLYLEFASTLFNRNLASSDQLERRIGKQAVVGLGFGMGHERFADCLIQNAPECLPILQQQLGVSSPKEAARIIVNEYRTKYNKIYDNVRQMYNAFDTLASNQSDNCLSVGKWLRVSRDGNNIVVNLPTGGFLTYREVHTERRNTCRGTEYTPRYSGGSISFSMPLENAVQAIARDIFARALLNLEQNGFEIAFHVHDEVIVEVPANQAPEKLEAFKRILGAYDERCPELPLACEAFVSDKYTNDEQYMRKFTRKTIAQIPANTYATYIT